MKIERRTVTPELATQWLGLNTHNRNARPMVVASYTEAMRSGDWLRDIDPIAFKGHLNGRGANAPVLLNGQHRLHAVVSADVAIDFIVIEGLTLEDQVEMDAGVKRQLADQIRLYKDIPYPVECASIVRLVYAHENELLRARNTVSYSTLLRFLDKHPDLPESVRPARNLWSAIGGRVSVWGACHYIISQIDDPSIEEDLEEFFGTLASGENLQPGSPLLALRGQMIQAAAARNRRAALGQVYLMAITFKAWNAWRDGLELHTLAWRGGGKHPEPFPTPA